MEIDIPPEMFEALKEEFKAIEIIVDDKKELLIEKLKSERSHLHKLLDCDIYLNISHLIQYLPSKQFPCVHEVFSMISSIQGSTSLVESMFSISNHRYQPNISTKTLEIHTLFDLNRHIQIREFI